MSSQLLHAYKAAVYSESVARVVFRFVPGMNLGQALATLKMFLAADPDCADKYYEAAKLIGKQVLMVSQELPVFCTLPDLQCVTTNCMLLV